ncbi:MAG: DUF1273 family protein [Myxococcales bacterium]|nr:DUF1273 family protein [Myxococcales bacterium]
MRPAAPPRASTIAVTGHRPPRLGGYTPEVDELLARLADHTLAELEPARVLTGMAQGWDLAIAEACARAGVAFTAALPFADPDARWPAPQRARLGRLLEQAASVELISPSPGPGAYHVRDRWMVERAELLVALWDGARQGGTFSTVRSAEKRGVPVHNVWAGWTALSGGA